MKGNLYLVPVTLGSTDYSAVIPAGVIGLTLRLRHYIVEDTRSARRYLRSIDKSFPIDETVFMELNEHTQEADLEYLLEPAEQGYDTGIMSEAGLPGLADPGARVVALAHRHKLRVIPLSGPSSIIMALISSGLNGQAFTFNGYLPVKPAERSARLKELEREADRGYAQMFIETPYRAQKVFEAITEVCDRKRFLTVAADITLPTESIKTLSISEWRSEKPHLDDRLVVFLLQ
jgi:16S rRNA (cytidine1402-2'-O)-methyltransferase